MHALYVPPVQRLDQDTHQIPQAVINRAAWIAEAGWPIGPRPALCTCGDPRWAHPGSDHTGPTTTCAGYQHDPADVLAETALATHARPALEAVDQYNQAARDARRRPGIRITPSDAGTCPRTIWYRETPPPGYQPRPQDNRKANIGTAIHAGLTEAHRALYPWKQFGLLVPIPGLGQQGEIDAYDPVIGEVEDWKTCGRIKWDRLHAYGPDDRHVDQVLIYALAAERSGLHVRRVKITHIDKETGEEFPTVFPYDRARAAAALAALVDQAEALDFGIEPDRARQGPTADWECRFCPALDHCWQTEAAGLAGRSPESYVRFGATVDRKDPAVIWTIGQAVEAEEHARDAAARKKTMGALVDGLPPGDYGDWEVYASVSTSTKYKAAYDNLAETYHRPEHERFPDGQLPGPARTRTTTTKVRRRFKALTPEPESNPA